MKRLFAILLTVLLLGAQVWAVAQPLGAVVAAKSACCDCKRAKCCVAPNSEKSSPLSAAAVVVSQPELQLLVAPIASPAWFLPAGDATISFGNSPSLSSATPVPLFTRHCALLI